MEITDNNNLVTHEDNEIHENTETQENNENHENKEDNKDNKNNKKSKKTIAIEWAKTIIIPIIIALLILQVIRPTIVQQQSMLPTVEPNDYLIVYKLAYKLGEPEDGDIIVFESNLKMDDDSNKLLIKRIIATEGETIQIMNGDVYVNGEKQDEPYINGDYTPGDVPLTVVPEDCVFVMGDNRPNSTDSRDSRVGFVSEDSIMGKVVIRLFPFNKIGLL